MGLLVNPAIPLAQPGPPLALAPDVLGRWTMHATFLQKVIICMIAGFLAACLWQWGIVFVNGADEALNGGYKKAPAQAASKPR